MAGEGGWQRRCLETRELGRMDEYKTGLVAQVLVEDLMTVRDKWGQGWVAEALGRDLVATRDATRADAMGHR